MRVRHLLGVVLCLALAVPAAGQRKKLEVGEPAPGLDIEQWVRGKETVIEKDHIYLVAFWATTSGPSETAISELSYYQERYGEHGLTVLAITTEESEIVGPWVERQGEKINYTVAVDRRRASERAWMQAAGRSDLPTAFLVDRKSRVVFIGNPNREADGERLEYVLKKVLVGRFDPKLERTAAPVLKAARQARKVRTWRVALKQYDNVIELEPRVFAEVAIERFEMMLVDMQDAHAAYTYAREKLVNGSFADDPDALAMLARDIATNPKVDESDRDMDLALEAAKSAAKLAGHSSPGALVTLALVHFHRGEIEEAIRGQRMAWMLARPREKAELKRVLESYQAAAGRASGLGR